MSASGLKAGLVSGESAYFTLCSSFANEMVTTRAAVSLFAGTYLKLHRSWMFFPSRLAMLNSNVSCRPEPSGWSQNRAALQPELSDKAGRSRAGDRRA